MDYGDLAILGISFGLGLLVGLQREASDHKLAGVRTFTLIAVLGTVSGFLARDLNYPIVLPLLAVAVTALMVMGNIISAKSEKNPDYGLTTEVAALLMFAVGAYLVMGNLILGVIIGGGMAVLLFVKERLHNLISRLMDKDLQAIMTFAGISLVILPILPDTTFGPLNVLNPHNIWLMVVLIVGISVVGYFIYKFAGQRIGIISNGLLGGIISSTATTVSYARQTAGNHSASPLAAFVIIVASAIALVRVLIEVGVVVPEHLAAIMVPVLVQFLVMAVICLVVFYRINKSDSSRTMPEPKNPAQFKSALVFGVLYGLILLAVAFAKEEFGNQGLYVVAFISGLTDMDAITLSLARLIQSGNLHTDMGWRLILLAVLSNLLFKGLMAMVLGSRQLGKWILSSFGVSILAGLLLIWLWPENWQF